MPDAELAHAASPCDPREDSGTLGLCPPSPRNSSGKRRELEARLRAAGSLLVAFSGGVDSSYLALAAHRALGARALAVTAVSPSYPASHRQVAERGGAAASASRTASSTRGRWRAPTTAPTARTAATTARRELFAVLGRVRDELGFAAVAYGVNTDDRGDFRPGHRAAEERGVLSPFLDVAPRQGGDPRALARRGAADGGSAGLGVPRVAAPLRHRGDARAPRAGRRRRGAAARARLPPAPPAPPRRASRASRSIPRSCRAPSIPRWRGASSRR